jgi:alpha-beta hydrolase superfamily lysophospholipase
VAIELVQTWTADGLRLDGTFQEAESAGSAGIAVDSFCLVHGTGGNFYNSTLFDSLALRLLELGCAVLRINTRGHDGISTAPLRNGGKRLGAAYEYVDDCRHDLAAWVEWLRKIGSKHIGLIGHSLGAVKCLYALAHQPNLGCSCVLALSPPRLSYSWFCSNPEGAEFLRTFSEAEGFVERGHGEALLDVKLPLPFVITAAGFLEKYGPDERYNYLNFLARVAPPVLLTLGSREVESNMAFRGAPQAVQQLRLPNLELAMIDGADHFYTGVRAELVARAEPWLLTHIRDI